MTAWFLTPRARDGLHAIIDYVHREFGPRIAEEVLTYFEVTFERLARRPGMGRSRADLTKDPKVRFWSMGPSLIAYRRATGRIEILMIERGERDWARLLG